MIIKLNEYNDKYYAKQRYVDRKNTQNREIETLTDEQHDAIQELCSIRHNIHSNWDDLWNPNSADYREYWDYIDSDINELLSNADLPTIDFPDTSDTSNSEDYYYVLDDDEREEWENIALEKAQLAKEQGRNSVFGIDGYSCWLNDSWEYNSFCNLMEHINNLIEDYLRNIDNTYGTDYCPTGYARLH